MCNLLNQNVRANVPALTYVSDLYRQKLSHASALRKDADQASIDLTRSRLRDHAWSLETDASCLAHCVAKFGDIKLAEIDPEFLRIEIADSVCEGRNPWVRGLEVIEDERAKMFPSSPTS